MSKVFRSPLRAPRRGPAVGLFSLLRAPGSVALAFALLASLAPLGPAARAQGAAKKGPEIPVAEDAPVYIIEQTPDGDASCRLDTRGEFGSGDGRQEIPVHQINHLNEKGSATNSASAGLTIVLRGTSRLELPANAQAKAAFIAAAAKWEALVSTQITVTIDVDYGPDFFGQPYNSSNTLGATSMGGFLPTYSNIRGRLINNAPAGSEERTFLNNLPATSVPTDIGDVQSIFVSRAQALALGISIPPETAIPRIGFNSNFAFDFDPTNGITSTQTDFDAVAVHEIGHALGFTSQVGARELSPSSPLLASLWDIYRFRPGVTAGTFSAAPRVLSSGTTPTDPHVSFSGAGDLALSTGKPDGTGGDDEQSSHWKDDRLNSGVFIGIMDPTIPRGRRETITANDLRALDYFGYSLGPPLPAPSNDNFAAAQTISGSTGGVNGTNVGATSEIGEQNHSPANDAGGKSVWFNWTAPVSGSATFDTAGSGYDTVLAAYTGSSVGVLSALAKNDDVDPGVITTSRVTFNASAGTTYRIAVDGWNGETGVITLNWNQVASAQAGTVQLSAATFDANEAAGVANIAVTRSGGTAPFSVNYSTTNGAAIAGSDYSSTTGTINFAANETIKNFAVPIINDSLHEMVESFTVALSGPTGGATLGAFSSANVRIDSDDAPPAFSVSDVTVTEGNAGTASAVFSIALSAASGLPAVVSFGTSNGTAVAGSDYVAASGTLNFAPGETTKSVVIFVNGDTADEDNENFSLSLGSFINAVGGDVQGQATIIDDDGPPPPPGSVALVQFGAPTTTTSETQGSAQIVLTRSDVTSSTVSVDVRTVDNPAAVACADIITLPGVAFARCDYATTIETVTFGPGETQKTVAVPLIDDAHGETGESVQLVLSNPSAGAALGQQATTTLSITSDEGPAQGGANPLAGVPFFVRQHYLDFLSREPEIGEPWSNVLNTCPNQDNQDPAALSAGCDRLTVSAAFFNSQEFALKGRYAFHFYKVAFGRLPEYAEIVADMRQLTGATGPEVLSKRAAFPTAFTQRADFLATFNSVSNEQFVNTMMGRYNLLLITTFHPSTPEGGAKVTFSRTGMTTALNNGQWTRAQVLRAIADSDEVAAAEFNPSFVAMQYYGYLRRTPEVTGYNAWLNVIRQDPNNVRIMVNGFMNSTEYKLRFGQP